MKSLIAQYIDAQANAWSPTTQKSEQARLNAIAHILDGNAASLAEHLQTKGSYTRLTTFTRVSAFYDWMLGKGLATSPNPYAAFKKINARMFKHAYKRKEVALSYEEAKEKIEAIADPAIRRRALEILASGARWTESEQSGESVVGKGQKTRRLFRPRIEAPAFEASYHTFLRKLKAATGLTPHDLRKLAATRFVANGAKEADLLKLMGWSHISTAAVYLQPKKDKELELLARKGA